MTVDSLSLDSAPLNEAKQTALCRGGVFTHNCLIRIGGGACPISRFDAQIKFEYFVSDDSSNPPV